MIKLALNTNKFNTFAFFCPVSRLHLTISNPVGFSDRVTPAILRGLKANTILDVNKVIDIATGAEKASQDNNKVPDIKVPESINKEPEAIKEPVIEAPKQSAKPELKADEATEKKQRGKRAAANPIDDSAEK